MARGCKIQPKETGTKGVDLKVHNSAFFWPIAVFV